MGDCCGPQQLIIDFLPAFPLFFEVIDEENQGYQESHVINIITQFRLSLKECEAKIDTNTHICEQPNQTHGKGLNYFNEKGSYVGFHMCMTAGRIISFSPASKFFNF